MGKKDKDNQSASSSSASKMSLERGRNPKPPRFSLRRFFCRRPSARSLRSMKSYNEHETRSVASFHAPSHHDRDRESPNTASHLSVDEVSHQSNSSVHTNHGRKFKDSIECPLCLQYQTKDNFPVIMTCHHRSCRDCLKQYLKIEITESRINIACPECSERFHPNDIKAILDNSALMAKYEEFMMRRVLVLDHDTRWCPAPDCGYAVIASGCASCPKLKCERPGCGSFFCYHCKQYWHPNQTCDQARAERNLRSSSISNSHESNANSDIKPCPRCGAFIVKMDDGSCNHMTCAVCGAEFCWLCMKEISDLHYLSPSGCTFWGKKPWSRKKKILWQLGTLVGAPVGIALVAGIAVPAMIIGIPVWVGKKLYGKYEHAPKHKRNLIIVGGVTASVIIAPVLAGLAVGIGVPILLAYVYGVVPISLCRSGGCGVTTNSSGVRFEFDDDNDVTVGVSGPYSGDVQSVEQVPHINNPSIGPSIGEMSLGMTNSLSASGSHMERIGIIHESDRESASHRAIAGNSLTGSLSGSTGFHTRVEIQADGARSTMSSKEKRASLSSESANFSLDAKSATISFGDNASTKALAGSICTKDRDNNSAVIPPFEVTQPEQTNTTDSSTTATSSTNQQQSANLSAGGSSVCWSTTTGCSVSNGGEIASKSRHGSPTSSRSVSFLCDEVGDRSGSVKKKKFKVHSVSVGDSIHEHSTNSKSKLKEDRISVHSLNTDSKSNTDRLAPSKSNVDLGPSLSSRSANESRAVSPVSVSHVHSSFAVNNKSDHHHQNNPVVNSNIGRVRSTSSDSVTSKHSGFNGPKGLPEVEIDRLGNLMEKGLPPKVGVSNSSEGGLSLSSGGNTNNNSCGFIGVGAKPKTSLFGSTGSTARVTTHRSVNQIDSCPALMCNPIAIDQSVESIYNKSTSLRTIPDPPPLTRSKVTIDGQKRVTYQRSPDSSDSMLNSPNLSETRSSSGSASDTSTCGLLKKGSEPQKLDYDHDLLGSKMAYV